MKKTILLFGLMVLFIANIVYGVNCSALVTDIQVDIDDEPYLDDKVDFLGVLPSAYRTQSVKCWSYIKRDDQYQQINPQVKEYSQTFFSRAKETEDREYFTAQNGMVSAYFTDKNLVAYTEFVLGIRCVSENTGDMVEGEKCITPYYKDLKQVPARGVWAVENMEMLVIITIAVIFLLILAGYFYRKIKGVL